MPEGLGSRRAALVALRRVRERGAWATPAVHAALEASDLDERDRAFAANLAYETLRWEGTLDWALARCASRPLDTVEADVLSALRIGAWQILFGRVPDRAAVDTTVELVRLEASERATGFANGVLRGLLRRRDRLGWPDRSTDLGLGLALGYPEWIVAAARARFGERAEAVLAAGNDSPGVTLRARGDRDALIAELATEGITAVPGRFSLRAVRAPGSDPGRLACVAEGRALVQDEASQLVGEAALAAAPDGARCGLDVCAAPGGKTAVLAEGLDLVVAGEVRANRARETAATLERLGLGDRTAVVTADGTRPPWGAEWADVVLVDAPCTGLGVVRRRPELRWRRRAGDAADLARIQRELVSAAITAVRPGGAVVYSACTWTVAETTDVLRHVLVMDGDRVGSEPPPVAGAGRHLGDDPGIQLDPAADDADGMYVAVLRRGGRTESD